MIAGVPGKLFNETTEMPPIFMSVCFRGVEMGT